MSNNLGEKIRRLRNKNGYTLEQLAKKMECCKEYVWGMENRNPSAIFCERLVKISKIFNVTLEFLLEDVNTSPSDEVAKNAFIDKFQRINQNNQKKLIQIIEILESKE